MSKLGVNFKRVGNPTDFIRRLTPTGFKGKNAVPALGPVRTRHVNQIGDGCLDADREAEIKKDLIDYKILYRYDRYPQYVSKYITNLITSNNPNLQAELEYVMALYETWLKTIYKKGNTKVRPDVLGSVYSTILDDYNQKMAADGRCGFEADRRIHQFFKNDKVFALLDSDVVGKYLQQTLDSGNRAQYLNFGLILRKFGTSINVSNRSTLLIKYLANLYKYSHKTFKIRPQFKKPFVTSAIYFLVQQESGNDQISEAELVNAACQLIKCLDVYSLNDALQLIHNYNEYNDKRGNLWILNSHKVQYYVARAIINAAIPNPQPQPQPQSQPQPQNTSSKSSEILDSKAAYNRKSAVMRNMLLLKYKQLFGLSGKTNTKITLLTIKNLNYFDYENYIPDKYWYASMKKINRKFQPKTLSLIYPKLWIKKNDSSLVLPLVTFPDIKDSNQITYYYWYSKYLYNLLVNNVLDLTDDQLLSIFNNNRHFPTHKLINGLLYFAEHQLLFRGGRKHLFRTSNNNGSSSPTYNFARAVRRSNMSKFHLFSSIKKLIIEKDDENLELKLKSILSLLYSNNDSVNNSTSTLHNLFLYKILINKLKLFVDNNRNADNNMDKVDMDALSEWLYDNVHSTVSLHHPNPTDFNRMWSKQMTRLLISSLTTTNSTITTNISKNEVNNSEE